MIIIPTSPRKRTSHERCFIVSILEGTRGNVHLSSTFYQLFLGMKDLVNNYPCNNLVFVSRLKPHSMQSCDPLSLCIDRKPSSNNSSIEIMPHPITTKGACMYTLILNISSSGLRVVICIIIYRSLKDMENSQEMNCCSFHERVLVSHKYIK